MHAVTPTFGPFKSGASLDKRKDPDPDKSVGRLKDKDEDLKVLDESMPISQSQIQLIEMPGLDNNP